jgi:hypothetical protein
MGKWGDLALAALRASLPVAAVCCVGPGGRADAMGPNGTNGAPVTTSRSGRSGTAPRRATGAFGANDTPGHPPELSAFHERVRADLDEAAAMHEFEGGLPREIAEALVDLRFWRPPPWRQGQSRQARLEAACVLADEWGANALARGWPASEFLGDNGPLDRLPGLRVVCIDEHGVDARCEDGRHVRYNRRHAKRGSKL